MGSLNNNNNNNNNDDNFKGEESNYLNKLLMHNQQFEKSKQYKLQSLTLRFLKKFSKDISILVRAFNLDINKKIMNPKNDRIYNLTILRISLKLFF